MTSADSIEQQRLRARRALAKGKLAQAHKTLTAAGVSFTALFAASESIHGKSHLTDRMMDWSWHFEAARILHDMFGFVQPDVHKAAMSMAACFELQDNDEFAESFFTLAIAAGRRSGSRELALSACEEYAAMLERVGRHSDAKALRRRSRSLSRVTGGRKKARQPITA